MSWTTSDLPDLAGRVAVVTGANGGLGLATARALAGAGATVVMASRNQEKAAAARQAIAEQHPDTRLELVPLDLASLASVTTAAQTIAGSFRAVDILVNNAGVMAVPEQQTADGFELQFGTNHLGHFAFTGLLLPALLRATSTRVVTVTSVARHRCPGIDFANPHLHGRYGPWQAYSQSKLANYYFGLGLQREFDDAGVAATSLLAHPGLSNTGLHAVSVRESGGGRIHRLSRLFADRTGMSAEAGALPQLRAAAGASARGGELYGPRFGLSGPPVRRPVLRRPGLAASIESLWAISESETGVRLDVTESLGRR